MVQGNLNGIDINLLNIYAPTQDKSEEQTEFYSNIFNLLNGHCNNLVWTGDFNLYLNPRLDHYNIKLTKASHMAEQLKVFLEDNNLCDSWRVRNPDSKRFTWRRMSEHRLQQSRLDYFIVAEGLMYSTEAVNIHPSFMSDHCVISIR